MNTSHPATFVVGDIHGQRDELAGALKARGLIDDACDWAGDDGRLWFLGDFVDRGPDGIGVIDLVMRLQRQASDAGGSVDSLLGNHEVLLLGMHRFGDAEVPSEFGTRSFARSWLVNGGQPSDQDGLADEHLAWLSQLPLVTEFADHLLLHSDTLEYLDWGPDVAQINASGRAVLAGDDLAAWWDLWRRLTTRYAFRGDQGEEAADTMLARLGGKRIVHGHSVIADQVGVAPPDIAEPHLYAGGKVLGIDAGLFVGGPCLVVRLPWEPAP